MCTGIGIKTGEVLSGNIGSDKRMDYTVPGDTVNIASGLEGLKKQNGTPILVAESTRQLRGAFTLPELDRVVLKGKTRSTRIYEVLGDPSYSLGNAERLYCEAMAAHREGDFPAAMSIFGRGADDARCNARYDRCRRPLKAPPPADWNGVWQALEK